jgi:hypothetical protein
MIVREVVWCGLSSSLFGTPSKHLADSVLREAMLRLRWLGTYYIHYVETLFTVKYCSFVCVDWTACC